VRCTKFLSNVTPVIARPTLLLALAMLSPLAPAQTDALPPLSSAEIAQGYREGYVLAKPRADHLGMVDAAEAREGLAVNRKFARFGALRVLRLGAGDTTRAAVRRLAATGRYEFVEPDYVLHPLGVPDDPDFSQQWGLSNTGSNFPGVGLAGADIHATAAWNTLTSAPNVVVAVLDTGVFDTHVDLHGNLWQNPRVNANGDGSGPYGINTSGNGAGTGTTTDDNGHGTHVAGIIGAIGNNGADTSGVAWKVQIMALKFSESNGYGTTVAEISAIDYAISTGVVSVINASFGTSSYSSSAYAAIQSAGAAGIIVVAAAGNNGTDSDLQPVYPANFLLDNIVTVAASDNRDDSVYFTNYGTGSVDLYAPGYNIFSLFNGSSTATAVLSGTSMSAPFVTGSLALLRAQFPGDTYRQLINRLLASVDSSVDGNANFAGRAQTAGRLDLATAVTSTSNRPFNDNFTHRAHLAGTNLAVRSNNAGATLDPGEPVVAGTTGGASLWWDWTAPLTGPVTLTTTGSAYATILAVYTGTSLGALTPVASSVSPGVGSGNASFTAQAGTTYAITVDGQGGASGLTLVNLNYANDAFASAATLAGTSVGITASNASATREPGEPEILGNPGGHSVWYAWTAPASGQFQVAAFSPAFDPLLAVYTGSSLSSLSLVAANQGPTIYASGPINPASQCTCTINATAGTTYMITVDGNSDVNGKSNTGDPYTGLQVGQFTLSIADSRWQNDTLDSVTGAPTVGSDGTVYVGSDVGTFSAFNPDGSTKWIFYGSAGPFDSSTASLSADGTTLYAVAVDYDFPKGYLYAINTANGALKWQFLLGNAPPACSPTVAADGTIYVKDQAGTLYALNPADGSTKWTCTVPGASPASPVMAPNGTIYLGSDNGSLYAISSTGTVTWTFVPGTAAANPIDTAAAIDGSGNVYFGTLGGLCYAVSPSGQQLWSYQAGNSISSSPALDDGGNVYFGCFDRYLYSLSPAGALNWKYRLGGEVRGSSPLSDSLGVVYVGCGSSPVIDANGVIYIGCMDGNVYAVNSTGTLNRIFATGGGVSSSPVIAGTTLYFGSTDHKLYAFEIGASVAGSAWPTYLSNSRREGRAVTDPLAITAQSSAAVSVTAPGALTLRVSATGEGPLSFQWKLNGVAIAGATDSTYLVPSTGPGNAGVYTAIVSGAQGAVTSNPITVTIVAVAPAFTLAASPAVATVATGRTAVFNAIATGTPAPSYQWTLNGSASIPGATVTNDPILVITSATAGDAGTLACTATNSDGSATSSAALAVVTASNPGYLANLSGRGLVGSGSANALYGGFGISGTGTKQLLIRGMGPSIGPGLYFYIADALQSTQLTLYNSLQAVLAQNSPWGGTSTLMTADALTGAYPPLAITSLDSMLYLPVATGSSSAAVGGVGGATGDAVIELYDADSPPLAAKLTNVAVRAPVGTGGDILFGGFAIGGTTDETVLIRGIGPRLGLSPFYLSPVLAQPVLTLYLGGTPTGYANTGWGGDPALANAMAAVGAYPLDATSQDSLLLVTLPPGTYSAEVSGVNGATGIAAVEVYEVY